MRTSIRLFCALLGLVAATATATAPRAEADMAVADLKLAEAWSLFNPAVREAHFKALRQLSELAK